MNTATHANTLDFSDLLAVLAPASPAALLPPANQAVITTLARQFPPDVATYFGFETPLAEPAAPADFAFSLSNNGLRWLAEGAHPWPNLASFSRLWGDSSDLPYSEGRLVWLEFDVARPAQVPSIFIALPDPGTAPPTRTLAWLSRKAFPLLGGPPLSSALLTTLARCYAQLPPQTALVQVGLMLSRPVDALRLCGFDFRPADVLPFLQRIGWPGDRAAVGQLLAEYGVLADYLCLHLDVGPVLYPTLGLELLFSGGSGPGKDPWNAQPAFEPRWYDLFDRLVADGYCLAEKQAALLGWPCRITQRAPLVERLIDTLNLARLPGERRYLPDGTLLLGLQHIKFALKPGCPVVAKGYFGARYDLAPQGTPDHRP